LFLFVCRLFLGLLVTPTLANPPFCTSWPRCFLVS